MPATYASVWRTVKLHCSAAPTFLIREWVQDAWHDLARSRPWAFLRAELRLTINAARTVSSVTVTRGSATVNSAGLFLAADNNRQFRLATFPSYTIVDVTGVPNNVGLDRPYGEDDAVSSASIYDGYAIMPADFGSFRLIADPYNLRRLAYWITEDQLNILDPKRMASDLGPRLLAACSPSPHPLTLGRIRYEYWPRPTTSRSYPALYNRQAPNFSDNDIFTGVLADASDALQHGALAHAAKWPGTTDKPNPYFNLALARELEEDFRWAVQQLALRDDDQYADDMPRVHWERWPLADLAYNDQALRATDATIADLY